MIRFLTAIIVLLLPARAEVVAAAHPSEKLPEGKTVVWSPLFQATWDALNAELGGKPLKVDPANELMAMLDGFIYGDAGDPWRIRRAEQVTKFELFEKGATIRVETSIEADPFGGGPEFVPIPRRFIYDRPFFVFLWRDGAEWPYFGAWIGDASALKGFSK